MTDVFLGIIAVATLVMAMVQVGVIVYGLSLARRVSKLLEQVETDMKPLLDNLSAMAADAARASSLAVAQVERVDRIFTDLTNRIEETASTVQRAVITPLREGQAIMAGIRAALGILKDVTGRSGPAGRPDDEEALFIG